MSTSSNQDSELQHSFGPGEVGFDYLPLQSATAPVPTLPESTVPTFDLRSSAELPAFDDALPAPDQPRPDLTLGGASSQGRFWLDGDTVLCGCPACKAPMSVRLWLMTADCWRCGISIDLTEEQEREISQLLDARTAAPIPAARAEPSAPQLGPRPVVPPPPPPPAPPARPKITPPPVTLAPTARRPSTPAVTVGPVGKSVPPPPPPTPPPNTRPPLPRKLAPAAPVAATVATTSIAPVPPRLVERPVQRPVPPTRPAPQRQTRPAAKPAQEIDWLKKISDLTPAWLVSAVVHLIILTLLGMFSVPRDEQEKPTILLSAMMGRERVEGGDILVVPPDWRGRFDMPLPPKVDLKNPEELKSLLAANQDALELRLDKEPVPHLAKVEQVKSQIAKASGVSQTLAARDPRLRVEMVTQEGGTTMTEAAVARGLRWLANHQHQDGTWRIASFHEVHDCNCDGRGQFQTHSPGTALALLPYLGAGQTHLTGKYKGTVSRGLRWLVQHQREDGDLRYDETGNAGMYTHGQAAIVLCEAFAMTGDEELRVPAQKAVDFIVKGQYRDGGWRYKPGPSSEPGDTSVVGWQLMALQSARAANLNVPETTLLRANTYLDSCQSDGGAQYAYMAGARPTEVMSAEALLCRMYLGWTKKQNSGLTRGARLLVEQNPPTKNRQNIYYWYYATQAMHHFGGDEWEEWNLHMRDVLTQTQETSGHRAGSWPPREEHAHRGGRIYTTALAVCTLEVYYRHLPIFRQIKLD